MSATRAERTLLEVRGLGPWSVNYLMMRSLGFADCVPLGDTGVTSGLQALFRLEERPDIGRHPAPDVRLLPPSKPRDRTSLADQPPRPMNQSPSFHYASIPDAGGQFSVAVDAAGSVVATAFGGKAALQGRLKDGGPGRGPLGDRRGPPTGRGVVPREAAEVLGAPFPRGNPLSAPGVGRPEEDTLWPDPLVRRCGPLDRKLTPGGRPGQRHQSHLRHRSVPPRDRVRRLPHRVRVRRGGSSGSSARGLGPRRRRPWTAATNAFSRAWSLTPGCRLDAAVHVDKPRARSRDGIPDILGAEARPRGSRSSPGCRSHVF
jgi:hypothetical protein